MEGKKRLPVGFENFEEIRRENFYYVDKTGMIRDLLNNWGKVNLFTRPRRFGKSLNMSMLKTFFEFGCDKSLFEGLEISGEEELCKKHMGQYPVIFISLKDVSGTAFEMARDMLYERIRSEALRFAFLKDSGRLSEFEIDDYQQLMTRQAPGSSAYPVPNDILLGSLFKLTELLYRYYGKKVILLIDEYDVPLEKAWQNGYYDQMAAVIRSMFSRALKGNDYLQFAVLTGCLRISRESIFTGLNNLKVYSVTNNLFNNSFGFTDKQIQEMLAYYGCSEYYEQIKEWYDGYCFGGLALYCPWDVINYVDQLRTEPDTIPVSYWVNSSGNDIIRRFICIAGRRTRRELENLLEGKTVVKKINFELTYQELYEKAENIWSILFMTGYLTMVRETGKNQYELSIPNREIHEIYKEQILEWFQAEMKKDTPKLDAFCEAFLRGDAETVETMFTDYLNRTISVRDAGARKNRKESFYHGILLGLLGHREDWDVYSNMESGDGYSDILVETDNQTGIVAEVKYTDSDALESGCGEALEQIEKKRYADRLLQNNMKHIIKYGIACNRKSCRVMTNEGQKGEV